MGRYVYIACCTPFQRCQLEVSAGSCTWTVPSSVYTATFELWGAGGASGAKCCCYCQNATGGFPGGYALKTISVTPGDTYTICAGVGGAMYYCSPTAIGCSGSTSYVTGNGLSNLCASGGTGGCSIYGSCGWTCVCNGGVACGGDINIMGGYNWMKTSTTLFCHFSAGGGAPFGGGESYTQGNHCCPYATYGWTGKFPGGGGAGGSNCCCDCCNCNGAGGNGLVRVTF